MQHDYNIANDSGANVRADLNNVLAAIKTMNSGATAPSATSAGMSWFDTSDANTWYWKLRNNSDDGWINVGALDVATDVFQPMIDDDLLTTYLTDNFYTETEVDTLLTNNHNKGVSSTDNAIVRFNGTTGQVQNSGVTIDDSGNLTANSGNVAGYGSGGVTTNSATGVSALANNTSGYQNVANGVFALEDNTTGYRNTATGFQSLANNTTGYRNTATGFQSLANNTTGYRNTATGYEALKNNTEGNENTANGHSALYNNTTGSYNVANGFKALFFNTTGTYNIATGKNALYYNTTGSYNTANGYQALKNNTTGNYNVANGTNTLVNNTTGARNTAIGTYSLSGNNANDNTAVGYAAMTTNTTGSGNTANGFQSLYYNTTGNYNTAIGRESLYSNTIGIYNVGLGNSALFSNVDGDYNVGIGHNALRYSTSGNPHTGAINCSGLGYNTRNSGNNQVQLGDSTTTTYVFGTVQNRSDARDKTGIEDTSLGLEFIKKIRPVEYQWDMRDDYFDEEEYTEEVEVTKTRFIDNPEFDVELEESEENKRQIEEEYTELEEVARTRLVPVAKDGSRARNRKHQGVIAQEVKAVIDELGVDFGGYQDHSIAGGDDVLSIGYDEFVAPLIKAVQEQQAMIEDMKARIETLEG